MKVSKVFSRVLNLSSWSLLNHGGTNGEFAIGWLEKDGLKNIELVYRFTKVFKFGVWYEVVLVIGNYSPDC